MNKIHQLYKCIRCGECNYTCPVFKSDGWDASSARGKMQLILAVEEGKLKLTPKLADSIFRCTTCKICEEVCSAGVKIVENIEKSRTRLVKERTNPSQHEIIARNIESSGNPFGEPRANPSIIKEGTGGDTIYFVGCMSRYRTPEITSATIKLLTALEEDFTILRNETCCGSVLLRTGRRDLAEAQARKNNELIKNLGAKRVIFSCAGCYRTFKEDYPTLVGDLDYKVLHITEFLAEVDLPLVPIQELVTYQDPCHIGRHLGIYQAPRDLIHKSGAKLLEMKSHRENANCCGAGGGVRAAYPELADQLRRNILTEAKKTGAELLLSACPFCVYHLKEAAKKEINVADITEFLATKLNDQSNPNDSHKSA